MAITSPESEAAKAKPFSDEADIGSGEKSPGELETQKIIEEIPALPPAQGNDQPLPGSPVERRQ